MQSTENNQNYDIVIVGAGPAGCTVARYLSDKFKILLVDKAEFPRDKPCGGLLVQESQHFIKQLEPLEFIFSKPKKLKLRLMDWDGDKECKVDREYLNVVREKFDHWILELIGNNVTFWPKTELVDFYEKGDGVKIVVNKDNKTQVIKTRYLIGADGAASTVRKRMSTKEIRTYVAIQESVPAHIDSESYFIFDDSITNFYSWVIPKGDHVVVGGAFPMLSGNIRERFDLLKKKLAKKLDLVGEYEERESCLILRPESTDDITLGKKNILLVGEAAGLISPSTGEGISFALRSGYLCAHALNGMKNVYGNYEKLCKPLLEEISDKLLKSEALSDVKRREKVIKRWEALSQPNAQKVAKELWAK